MKAKQMKLIAVFAVLAMAFTAVAVVSDCLDESDAATTDEVKIGDVYYNTLVEANCVS